MRHRSLSLVAALVLGLSLGGAIGVPLVLTTGCASTATPARKSFTAIADAAEAVKTGMQVFNQRYQAGL
ncbi:MAG: hypothetical protein PHS14_17985, partial [Elusimicrobia bacterium]|nr:hypothetical protein [Elusimicrobiota bacterium]